MESTDRLLAGLFGTDAMRRIFSDRARLQAMLDFEAALARAEAGLGLIPEAAAAPITAACDAARFDIEALSGEAGQAGNTAIPLVKRLIQEVAREDAEAARSVHFGSTSQDVMDTGLVLQMRAALDVLEPELEGLCGEAARLAEEHRDTLAAGRTWMQHALPVTFGLRAAGWLSALERHRERFKALRPQLLVLQFGGAAGTLASLGKNGVAVAEAVAGELDLAVPDIPWHTHRDRIAEAGAVLGMLIGTLGKIARDVSLLMQTEIGEVFEPTAPGRGGSSAMPHKRNPVASSAVLSAALRAPGLVATLLTAMAQEHERGLGNWPAEWTTLPQLFELTAGAIDQTRFMLSGLEVDAERMRANLEATGGLILAEAVKMALTPLLGGPDAYRLVEAACKEAISQRRHLREVLGENPAVSAVLDAKALDALFDPARYLGAAGEMIDRVLAAHKMKTPRKDGSDSV